MIVTSRKVVGLFAEQLWFRFVPVLHRLQWRLAAQGWLGKLLIAARNMLQMPNPSPMSDIAYRFAFSDQAQFSRLFKAMFGQTPSSFRASQTGR